MGKKLKASDFLEVDDEFVEQVAKKLQELKGDQPEKEYFNTAEIAQMCPLDVQTIRRHCRNYNNNQNHKTCLRSKKVGRDFLVHKDDVKTYLSDNA